MLRVRYTIMHGGALTLSYVIPTDESPSDAWYCFPEVCFQGMLLLSSKHRRNRGNASAWRHVSIIVVERFNFRRCIRRAAHKGKIRRIRIISSFPKIEIAIMATNKTICCSKPKRCVSCAVGNYQPSSVRKVLSSVLMISQI